MPSKHILEVEKADTKWRHKNPKRSRYLSHRTSARTFVRHYATKEDMKELNNLWKNRMNHSPRH